MSDSLSKGLFVSAPGKLILFGEHAVVYGKTAIAGSIDLRTYASLFTSNDDRIQLSLPDLGIERTWSIKDLLEAADRLAVEHPIEKVVVPSLEVLVPIARELSGSSEGQSAVQDLATLSFWYLLLGVAQRNRNLLGFKATIRSKLPSYVGLGSSGAYCVCIATLLLQYAQLITAPSVNIETDDSLTWGEKDLDIIRKWSTAAEALIHGRTSGLDAAISTYGGVASYNLNTGIEHFNSQQNLRVILINSNVQRNTSSMVNNVKKLKEKLPGVVDSIFNGIDEISKEGAKILQKPKEKGDASGEADIFGRLNELSRINNHLLNSIGVGHPKLDQICTSLSRYGIHPKITGAGGGGSVFAFLKPDTSQTILDMMKSELNDLGFEVYHPYIGSAGAVQHNSCPDLFLAPSTTSTAASEDK